VGAHAGRPIQLAGRGSTLKGLKINPLCINILLKCTGKFSE
jgi:hypothetical protein